VEYSCVIPSSSPSIIELSFPSKSPPLTPAAIANGDGGMRTFLVRVVVEGVLVRRVFQLVTQRAVETGEKPCTRLLCDDNERQMMM